MTAISRFDLTSRLCRITCYGDMAFLFLSGDTPKDRVPDHARQATEVFERLDAMLAEAGSHRSMILSATIWVDGVEACGIVEQLFAKWIGEDTLPAVTIGAARLVSAGKLIEVGLICRRHTSEKEAALPKIERLVKTPLVSRIVKYGDLIFLSGVTSPEPDPDARRQVAQVLERIDGFLAQAGSDKHHILSATVWLSDARNADAMNAAWDEWVSKESPPARATVEARLVSPKMLIEISIIAAPVAA